jgi:hypothetical protein
MGEESRGRFLLLPIRSAERELSLDEQLLNECGAMVRFTSAAGKRIPPAAAETVAKLVADRASHKDEDSQWRTEPCGFHNLAIAHFLLSRVVSPATPQSITVLNQERPRNRILTLLGPIRLIRWMMVLAVVLLVTFLVLLATEDVRTLEELTAPGTASSATFLTKLWSALFLLCAAGLGAIFANLFRANAGVEAGTYDPKEESSYAASIVMGMIAGVILARVVSANFDALGKLTEPLLALLGGFSAPAVYRLLSRIAETIETLVQGNASDQIAAHADAILARANANAEIERARLAARALRLREMADRLLPDEALKREFQGLLEDLLPPDETTIRIPETEGAPSTPTGGGNGAAV